jgi:GGDEF domain-containing protein
MLLSIRKIFSHLKILLLLLGGGVGLLTFQLLSIAQTGERLNQLQEQRNLTESIVHADTKEPKMGAILIEGLTSELSLKLKNFSEEGYFSVLNENREEQLALQDTLTASAEAFRTQALSWSQSLGTKGESGSYRRLIEHQTLYHREIEEMIGFEAALIARSAATAKGAGIALFLLGLGVYLFYRNRLNLIYRDIDRACAIDIDKENKTIRTKEIDFILKRLSRKSTHSAPLPVLSNPTTGMHNQKGLINAFNAKKSSRGSNSVFVALFEIDQYTSLINTLTPEEMAGVFKKIGEIVSLYEQPLDVSAHTDNDQIVFLLSRNDKYSALDDCQKIIQSVAAAGFMSSKGIIRITVSGGFLFKTPNKSVDEAIEDALELAQKAKENGGNQLVQFKNRADI